MNREELEAEFQQLYIESKDKEAIFKLLVLSSSSELLESVVRLLDTARRSAAFDCARGFQS